MSLSAGASFFSFDSIAEPIFAGGDEADAEVTDFIISAAVASCYAKLLTEKMIIYKNE